MGVSIYRSSSQLSDVSYIVRRTIGSNRQESLLCCTLPGILREWSLQPFSSPLSQWEHSGTLGSRISSIYTCRQSTQVWTLAVLEIGQQRQTCSSIGNFSMLALPALQLSLDSLSHLSSHCPLRDSPRLAWIEAVTYAPLIYLSLHASNQEDRIWTLGSLAIDRW
jgi:hypothetical protein